MEYEIKNEDLTVRISSKGGELRSVCDKNGKEYLWQGNRETWADRGPNLFPYIGRLTKGTYTYEGKAYQMGIHGFLMHTEMDPVLCEKDTLVLKMEDSGETRKEYPFSFRLEICWKVEGPSLEITYRVINQDKKTMYFGIGGHPGFQVPFEQGKELRDYCLDFSEGSEPVSLGLSEDCFMNGKEVPMKLRDGRFLDLDEGLFAQDSLVLREMPRQVILRSKEGGKGIRLEYPQMPYLVLWTWPGMQEPFLCVEPWSSLPSRKDVTEDLAQQENLVSLKKGGIYENKWSLTLGEY